MSTVRAGRLPKYPVNLYAAEVDRDASFVQDFALDRMQNDEEAYLAAGYSVAEAKTIPGSKMLLPCVLRAGKPRTK